MEFEIDMKWVSAFFTFLTLVLTVSAQAGVSMKAFVEGDSSFKQVTDLVTLTPGAQVFISINADEKVDTKVTLGQLKNGSWIYSDISNVTLEPNITVRLPQKGKTISFDDVGYYVISAQTRAETSSVKVFVQKKINDALSVTRERYENMATGGKLENRKLYMHDQTLAQLKSSVKRQKKVAGLRVSPVSTSEKSRSAGRAIYKQFAKSVVLIAVDDSLGSGVLLDPTVVLTNKHVVGKNSYVSVIEKPADFEDISSARSIVGKVMKFDDSMDLALVQLQQPIDATPIPLAAKSDVEIAMKAHAIGHPQGNYWSYTEGVISQIRPNYEWTSDGQKKRIADVIQTQTPINPGNSGGPLFSSNGKLIGINSFGAPNAPGLNFAVAFTSIGKFLKSKGNREAEAISSSNSEGGLLDNCDTNPDSSSTRILFCDRNNDGIYDVVVIDEERDGDPPFTVLTDDNQNGNAEMAITFLQVEGKVSTVVQIDPNETGAWVRTGYDFDADGEVDAWEDS